MTDHGVPIVFGVMIAFAIWLVARRSRERQLFKPRFGFIKLLIYLLLCIELLVASLKTPALPFGVSAAILLGVWVGFWGVRFTKFEKTDEGCFYQSDWRFNVAMALLFYGGGFHHIWTMQKAVRAGGQMPPALNPPELLIAALIIGYLTIYHLGLLTHMCDRK